MTSFKGMWNLMNFRMLRFTQQKVNIALGSLIDIRAHYTTGSCITLQLLFIVNTIINHFITQEDFSNKHCQEY